VDDGVLDDLRNRLGRTRWTEQIDGAGWDYGADISYVRELCEYWRDGYDWRLHEARLNEHPQFICEVDGLDIHFQHVKGKGPNPLPLLLIHGWPGSICEYQELIGPLTDPASFGGDPADSFDLVIPSLPGFGFSGRPRERGWGTARMAAALDRLMVQELGYERYAAQGGDWGSLICARLAAGHADHVAAIHVTAAGPPPPADPGEADLAYGARHAEYLASEGAYMAVQGTKPDSLTLAQTDSPAGLAAWIIEKFQTWSDCDGQLESVFSKDQLITNLMFYWAPASAASAARLYYEFGREGDNPWAAQVSVPTGVMVFPTEIWMPPRRWLEEYFPVSRWTESARGGHFDAFEQPAVMTDDLREFLRGVRR
jgi:microsomal epoxide hydrolase